MKKFSVILTGFFLITSFGFMQLNAQQKSEEDKDKELKIKMVIEEQKKAMTEQKKAQEEALKQFKEQQKQLEESLDELNLDIETINIEGDTDNDIVRIYGKRGDRSFRWEEPIMVAPVAGAYFGHSYGDNSERTTWEFSKSVRENTFKRDYSFDVEGSAKSVVMSVMGDCKAGEIRIKILMPNGKTYSEIVIDEFGNLNWRKSFSITETENKDKTGEWKFQISSDKATGYFKISLQTS